jgi:hypothetical protein
MAESGSPHAMAVAPRRPAPRLPRPMKFRAASGYSRGPQQQ